MCWSRLALFKDCPPSDVVLYPLREMGELSQWLSWWQHHKDYFCSVIIIINVSCSLFIGAHWDVGFSLLSDCRFLNSPFMPSVFLACQLTCFCNTFCKYASYLICYLMSSRCSLAQLRYMECSVFIPWKVLESPDIKMLIFPDLESPWKRHRSWKSPE